MPNRVPARPKVDRLFLGAAISLAGVVVLCAISLGGYASAVGGVQETLEVRRQVYEWLITLLDAETGARGFVASDRSAFLEPYNSAVAKERGIAAGVRGLLEKHPTQGPNIEAADGDAQATMAELQQLVALGKAGHQDQALEQLESGGSKQRMDHFRAAASRIRAEEERLLAESRAQASSRGVVALANACLLALIACGLVVLGWRREGRHDDLVTTMAREARGRLKALSELAAALSEARSRAEVAQVIVAHGTQAAGADTCTFYQLEQDGSLLLIGDRGVAPEVLDKVRRITEDPRDPGIMAAFRTGTSVWVEDPAEYAARYPSVSALKSDGPRAQAFWSIPLVAEGRSLGLLGMGFYAPRHFSPDERAFCQTLANHCAQSFMRATRLESEHEARRWLTTTMNSIGDAVIATDTAGRVTFINPVAEKLTGWTTAEARGRPLDEVFCVFSERTGKLIENPVVKVLREGTIVGLANHTVIRSRRGIEVPIADSGAPIRDDEGVVQGVVLVFRDATLEKRERDRSEFLAKAGEALVSTLDYHVTLATVARFVVPSLADWCSVEFLEPGSKSGRQVTVAHVDEAKVRFAKELTERYPPDPNATTGVPQVLRTGKSELYPEIPTELLEAGAQDAEHLRIIRDLKLHSAMVVPLRVRDRILGAITFVYAESGRRYNQDDLQFAEDFARRAAMAIENAVALREADQARDQERALRNQAEQASRSKDEFLATVSHELRTPLHAILGWTLTMRGRKPPEELDRGLAIIERNARLQTKLIEDVLDISRIISGKLALNLHPASVGEAVAAAIETVGPAADAKEIRVTAEFPPESLLITADPDRLQQIIWNLLSNAVKFTPRGGKVAVRTVREGSQVSISVTDTGEGIRRDVLPLIFQPFQQADASTTRRHGGLGLGLAIVKQLVTAHGGTVEATSEGEGKGSTFVVRLPARAVLVQAGLSSRAHLGAVLPQEPTEPAPRLDGLKILVVDDDEDARNLVSEVLREQGGDVRTVASADEALQIFAGLKPDVVVSDIGMPGTDGLAFIRKIRALSPDQGGRTPAIALTAYARSEEAQRAFAAGFQIHVAKPVEPTQLATVVANLGGRSLT